MPIGDSGYWLGSGWTLGGFNLVMNPAEYNFPVSQGNYLVGWFCGYALFHRLDRIYSNRYYGSSFAV